MLALEKVEDEGGYVDGQVGDGRREEQQVVGEAGVAREVRL
jgi:hypothetical protein